MNFYSFKMFYTSDSQKPFLRTFGPEQGEEYDMDDWGKVISRINANYFGMKRGLNKEIAPSKNFNAVIYTVDDGCVGFLCSFSCTEVTMAEVQAYIKDVFSSHYAVKNLSFSMPVELTLKEFSNLSSEASDNNFTGWSFWRPGKMNIEFIEHTDLSITEYVMADKLTRKDALNMCSEIMGEKSLIDEIERIYSAKNKREFYGHPVHYKLCAANRDAAMDILNILVPALITNGRLLGRRLSYVKMMDDDSNFEDLSAACQGNIMVLEVGGDGGSRSRGRFASRRGNIYRQIENAARKYNMNTLFIIVETVQNYQSVKELLPYVQETLDLIELKESRGNRAEALSYLERLSARSRFKATKKEIEKILPDDTDIYTGSQVYDVYQKWLSNGLKRKVYRAYKDVERKTITATGTVDKAALRLSDMIGLTEVKEMIDSIVDFAKVKKLRQEMGVKADRNSMHMIFTGNPGCAKTTVARLLSQILTKEGILSSGCFIECGRADLVARYVGWTAKAVKEKFAAAAGGVLFIDEAYALVDGSNTFGDEAINTIVQEMENHRDDVIVIFAGYPEKMKKFLDKNEGLRSRISFHVNFPDYSPEEMVKILALMAKEKGYELSDDCYAACRTLFEKACEEKEFGNGRYARNLIEHAALKQARRLAKKGKAITRKEINCLEPEDFVDNYNVIKKETRMQIGFTG